MDLHGDNQDVHDIWYQRDYFLKLFQNNQLQKQNIHFFLKEKIFIILKKK